MYMLSRMIETIPSLQSSDSPEQLSLQRFVGCFVCLF
jgi:hypothetical protein